MLCPPGVQSMQEVLRKKIYVLVLICRQIEATVN